MNINEAVDYLDEVQKTIEEINYVVQSQLKNINAFPNSEASYKLLMNLLILNGLTEKGFHQLRILGDFLE